MVGRSGVWAAVLRRMLPVVLAMAAGGCAGPGDAEDGPGATGGPVVVPDVGDWMQPRQSTSGPVPPLRVQLADAQAGGAPSPEQGGVQVTIAVPDYQWRHGCGPTAVGMVVGFFDGNGFPNLVPGSAATQTADVDQAIASQGGAGAPRHYEDYSLPLDDPGTGLLADRSPSWPTGTHANDSIADFMKTSWSSRSNYYGWSWSSEVGPAFRDFVALRDPGYQGTYQEYWMGYNLTWAVLKAQIDGNRPMVFLVDTDGDGGTDHFVTVVGYRDSPTQQYGCLDTWYPAGDIRWADFKQIAGGTAWGIWGAWSFNVQHRCIDGDGDGYGNPASAVCAHPEPDCDDGDASRYPGAPEKCNGKDDDCDGGTDEDVVPCSDGNACTTVDACVGGTCVGSVLRDCGHGTCIPPGGTCVCAAGWQGATCTQPICTSACVNGTCTAPDTCTCTAGWQGATCAQPICTSACVNGTCTAPDTCTCAAGWDGATCADPICTSACVNGTCTAPDTCACAAGWDGATCAQFTCDPGCGDNASCTGPDTCTCDDGFEGDGHACTPANPCADQPDWTPCDAGACFAETCEPVGENDACEDAIGLEPDVPVLATLAGFHAWWTEAPSCLDLPGGLVDAFYRFQGQAGVRYVVILTPAVDLDAALILRGACDVAGDGCIDGADDGGAGVPESVTLTPVADGPVLIQVTRRADSGVEFEIRVQVADDPGDDPGGDGVSADEAFADEAAPDATDPRDVPSSDVAWPEDPGASDASDEDASGDDASGDDASREDAPGTDATVRDPGAGDDPGDDPDASVDAVTRDADPGVPDGDSRKRGGCVATPGRAAASGPMLLLLLAVWGVFARVRRRPT